MKKKADLHLHSIYSEHPSEWFLQKLGAAESYTQPDFIYKELKKRGMDYITITDHNKIAGAMLLKKKYPDEIIVGLEATAYFPEDKCKIHILVYGLNELQYDIIQTIRTDIYELRDYLKQENLTHAVAHPTYSVNGKLTQEHLEKLILLFDHFEGINGGRNKVYNNSWIKLVSNLKESHITQLYEKYKIEPFSDKSWIKGLIGGSDDHGGLFLGKTYTETEASSIEEFLESIKNKKTKPFGRHNDFKSLAFHVYKIALDFTKDKSKNVNNTFFNELSSFFFEDRPISLVNKWKLKSMNRSSTSDDEIKKAFSNLIQVLKKKKNLTLEERFEISYNKISDIVDSFFKVLLISFEENISQGNLVKIIRNISSSLPGVFITLPFYSSINHMYKDREMLNKILLKFGCEEDKNKNILWFTDTIDDLNGVSVTLRKVHEISKKNNYSIKIVSSSKNVPDDENYINLPIMHEFNLPYYEHQKIKVPSLLAAMDKIHKADPDKIIISTPGPVGLLGFLASKLFHLESIAVYHTDFTGQTNGIKDDESLVSIVHNYTQWFYQQMDTIYVPSKAYMDIIEKRGIDREKMKIFPRGIEYDHFYPRNLGRSFLMNKYNMKPGIYLLYTGRISTDKSLNVILDAFNELVKKYPNLYLLMVGDGPHKTYFENEYKNNNIIFTGKVPREELPDYYSGADLFLFPSITDTFGMSVLEAQACCLPAFVSSIGGPKEIIEDGETGRVIKDQNIETWKNKIGEFIDIGNTDPEKIMKMKINSRENVKRKLNWEKFFNEFIN